MKQPYRKNERHIYMPDNQLPQSLPRGRETFHSSLKRTYRPNVLTSYRLNRAAFTLAEVLITLGIIGVVAAMTIPTLVANHRKRTVEVALAKFYTTMNQAIKLAENDYGEMIYWAPDSNSEKFGEWWEKYLSKYVKNIYKKEAHDIYYDVAFNDGSGFRAYLTDGEAESRNAWIFFCLKFEKCIEANDIENNKFNGIDSFLFAICKNGKFVSSGYCESQPGSRDALIRGCANSDPHLRHACTMLIQYDGWKISKDYPQKI